MKAAFAIVLMAFIACAYTQSGSQQCPETDGDFPVFFPHPKNCSLYYVCHEGRAIGMQCPPGLHFNRKLDTCDNPKTAKCVIEKLVIDLE